MTRPNAKTQGRDSLLHCWWECKMVQPHWKARLVVSNKAAHTLTIQSNSHVPWCLPRKVENSHKSLHADVYSNFIHDCRNVEATKMALNKRMDKLRYIHTMEYYSAIKRNVLSSHKAAWQHHKDILLSERRPS